MKRPTLLSAACCCLAVSSFLFGQEMSDTLAPDTAAAMAVEASSGDGTRNFYFPNIDIRSAFKAVAAAGKVDIVLSPAINGRAMLTLTGKTWKQALEVLCQMNALHFTIEDEYIYIQTLAEYNSAEKDGQLVRKIINVKHTKVKDLEVAVQGLLSPRGKVTVVEKSNAMIINDLKTKMDEILVAIQQLDVETFQVHIQARIIETSSTAAQELGINWGYGDGLPPPDVTDIPSANAGNAVLGTSTPGRIADPALSFGFRLLDGKLGAAIESLIKEGNGEVVAKPQITTLDNTEARIFIGEKRPFLKLDANLNSTTEFVDAGVELIVTPHLTNDGRIILDLAPQRSEARTDAVTREPIVTTTEAKTTVVVNDGETVVIGGLTSKTENKTESGIPLLKDIPLLGILFKTSKMEVLKKDLIIFITPYIVKKTSGPPPIVLKEKENAGPARPATAPAAKQDDDDNVEFLLQEIGAE